MGQTNQNIYNSSIYLYMNLIYNFYFSISETAGLKAYDSGK